MIAVMVAASHRKIVGDLPMPPVWRVLGWLATGAMALATVAMVVLQTSSTLWGSR